MLAILSQPQCVNSLAPGRSGCDSKNGTFNLVLLIGIFRSSHDNALRWMPQDLTDDKSTLVQVMAWCCQATSHYLSQCWLSSLWPYGIAKPQWVKGYSGDNSVVIIDSSPILCHFPYYHDVIWVSWPASQIAFGLFFQKLVQAYYKDNIQGSFCACALPMRDDDSL